MVNTLLTPQIIARRALERLESNKVMAGLVYTDYSTEFNQVGDTITIRKPATFTAQEFTGATSTQNITETSDTVVLNKHLDVTVDVTTKQLSLDIVDFSSQVIDGAVLAITEKVDQELCQRARDFYSFSGTSGTTPSALSDLTAPMLKMNQQRAPQSDRYMVFDPIAQAKLLELDTLNEADKSGWTAGLREATMGRIMGFNTFMDQNVYVHTAGGYAALADVTAAGAAGAYTMALTSAAGVSVATLLVGDIFHVTKAGVDYQFVVTATTAAAIAGVIAAVAVYPALPTGGFAGEAVTFADVTAGGHIAGFAAHKNALALVSRQLSQPMGGAANYYIATLPSGLSIRVTMGYSMTSKTNTISFDMLIGTKNIHKELGTRILG